ncbi:probable LRR receptor-like serine/threonine-protein kinase At1g05700 [Zingiber officinale]|uniref:probable LRR receptor-like serine/threonine-protein kinase At1g05700 n=1 Tax=Zingiber officinale TaxID=94328 RepID=UPI001C4CA50C|nr:probable LRR receptor-like serine/threonine-protein kinase At1g05700 [Zingiber officinale]
MLCFATAIAYRKKKMNFRFWWLIQLVFAMASAGAHSQSTETLGFLSIDCGIEPGSSYVDPIANISYVSDAGFIDTGVNHNISVAYEGYFRPPRVHTLRAFPNGVRNCYTIGSPAVARGSKYLLRAWFVYGNYDGLSGQPQSFDLHLGVNYWDKVNVTTAESSYWTETITVATAGYLSVCLVNIGKGTPFISGIDLRPLKDNLYPAANEWRSLVLFDRANMGVESGYTSADYLINWGYAFAEILCLLTLLIIVLFFTVDAMTAIKEQYRIQRNWMGDPCSPNAFVWDGLNCTYSFSNSPRVIALNLSSSGLTGEITKYVANLSALQYLDLSYNNLTGPIPDDLANLSSLKLLDLTGNLLNGSVPSNLLEMAQNGLLTLRLDGNPHLCDNGTSCNVMPTPKKKKLSTPVILILCIVPMLILFVVIAIVWRVRKTEGLTRGSSVDPQNGFPKQADNSLRLENRQFTHIELQNITNNFQKILGKGGFGSVFHGRLEDGTQIAVKMLSQSSSQGTKEFLAEAQHLTRVHHRNLVSLVGYCNEVNHLALVYEFMSQGTLQDHLRGRANDDRALSWRQRLHIAIDAAQGLEYLHKGCKPPLVHRDVKSGNILLSETLEAKIADFGLSKAFLSEVNSHISTVVMGTPGYLDPEYYNTFQLSEKSDVYSYGVVLLELITGLPSIVPGTENVLLVQWVLQRFSRGNIEDVVDPKLEREYDINCVWKCADIALKCTTQRSQQRPTMTEVLIQLKESLELENSHYNTGNTVTRNEHLYSEVSDVSLNSVPEIGVSRMLEISGPTTR